MDITYSEDTPPVTWLIISFASFAMFLPLLCYMLYHQLVYGEPGEVASHKKVVAQPIVGAVRQTCGAVACPRAVEDSASKYPCIDFNTDFSAYRECEIAHQNCDCTPARKNPVPWMIGVFASVAILPILCYGIYRRCSTSSSRRRGIVAQPIVSTIHPNVAAPNNSFVAAAPVEVSPPCYNSIY